MTRSYFPFLLAVALLFGGQTAFSQIVKSAEELEADGKKRYGIESGRIKYEYSNMGSGTEMVHFDRWGWLEMREVDMQNAILGRAVAQKRVVLLDGTQQITHNPGSSYASASMDRHLTTALQKASPAVEVLFGEEALLSKGAKRAGRDEVMGRSCAVYEIPTESAKVWVWKGIVLKYEKTLFDKRMTMTATMIDEEWEPVESTFELPEGLTGLPGKE